MRNIPPFLLLVAGIALGFYVGLYLMFICGVAQVVGAMQADPISGYGIAVGLLRVMFAGPAGGLSGLIPVIISLVWFEEIKKKSKQ